MSALKALVVTATDDTYAPLANDLFQSIARHSYVMPFRLALLDVGLSAQNRQHFEALGIQVVQAQADIDYPARQEWERNKPGIRALTAKPFLRRYFPDNDIYIWLDADIWVQTPEAINTMLTTCAQSDALCLATEFDRSHAIFSSGPQIWDLYRSWYAASFDAATVTAMDRKQMLNVGVLGLSNNSPLWDAWAALYSDVLMRTPILTDKTFMAEQLSLNILCAQGLPHKILPANFNWLTGYTIPMLDRGKGLYVETQSPYSPISHIHLTRPNKLQAEKIRCLDGTVVEKPLTFWASQR